MTRCRFFGLVVLVLDMISLRLSKVGGAYGLVLFVIQQFHNYN